MATVSSCAMSSVARQALTGSTHTHLLAAAATAVRRAASRAPARASMRAMGTLARPNGGAPLMDRADGRSNRPITWDNPMPHNVWSKREMTSVQITHLPPKDVSSTAAYRVAKLMRHAFDWLSGFKSREPDEKMYIDRIVFLETVAAVPGMVAGTLRHLQSLRRMERDKGWIHMLLEEAENERMHLLTFMTMKQPGPMFRAAVVLTQGLMYNALFLAYLVHPSFCHRLVGYIEEEAVKTYTGILRDIDAGKLPKFETMAAPEIAKQYWRLAPDASFRDLILAVRADEANHREVNHSLASVDQNAYNPFLLPDRQALPATNGSSASEQADRR